MAANVDIMLREQLFDRRQQLESAVAVFEGRTELVRLLDEVDAAIERMDAGTYGLCEVCHESIEPERLIADPLCQLCLDHLTPAQQRDLEDDDEGDLYFILGDVSGKGGAASMLMSHLHAMFRSLISVGLPLHQLVERVSRVFCESTLPMHYATLVCGRAGLSGERWRSATPAIPHLCSSATARSQM